jgi:small subunit ribosomal protein S6
MFKRYETIFISRVDLSSDETSDLVERYKGIIESLDGKIVKVDNWGRRKLAYMIAKNTEGNYSLVDFVCENEVISELQRNFRLDDKILRFQSVKLSDKVDMEEIEKEIASEKEKAAASAASADEAAKQAEESDVSGAEEVPATEEPAEENEESAKEAEKGVEE